MKKKTLQVLAFLGLFFAAWDMAHALEGLGTTFEIRDNHASKITHFYRSNQ